MQIRIKPKNWIHHGVNTPSFAHTLREGGSFLRKRNDSDSVTFTHLWNIDFKALEGTKRVIHKYSYIPRADSPWARPCQSRRIAQWISINRARTKKKKKEKLNKRGIIRRLHQRNRTEIFDSVGIAAWISIVSTLGYKFISFFLVNTIAT